MAKKNEYFWYVEPLDSYTNQAISRLVSDENFQERVPNGGAVLENVWRCPRKIVTNFEKSRRQLGLKFHVYVQRGGGKIRQWIFGKK
jgi:hypothetical protein